MAKEFAAAFYKSKQWQHCRNAYVKSVGGLCEDCLIVGKYTAGEIVHHVINLSPKNIDDPNVTLNWTNLRLVCRECHAKEHGARAKRYTIEADGSVKIKSE